MDNPHRLTRGCTLLLAGSMADFLGNRKIYLIGCFFLGVFILASGFAKTGIQLIIFRAFQGIAVSFCLPTAVSVLTDAFPTGRRRNIGFACLGLGQPLGFSVGLVLGGFFVDTVGWRVGFYLCAGACAVVLYAGTWAVPRDRPRDAFSSARFLHGIDWVGATFASACLGMFSYTFASVLSPTSFNLCYTLTIYWRQSDDGGPISSPRSSEYRINFHCCSNDSSLCLVDEPAGADGSARIDS